jgi:hypothetical protein
MQIAMHCTGQALIPIDDVSEEFLLKRAGKDVMVKIIVARNVKHNAWAHKLFAMVADNHPTFTTIDAVKNEIKLRAGFVTPEIITVRVNRDVKAGERATAINFRPRSTSFHEMDEMEFRDFMQKAIRIVCTDLLPGIEQEDIAMEILRIAA